VDQYPIDWESPLRALLEEKGASADEIGRIVDLIDESRWERYYDGMAAQREIDYE
jgi:hypothetical protein